MSGQYRARQDFETRPSLGQQLRQLREAAARPGREVAAAAKIDSGLLSKIENGKRPVTQVQLGRIAKFFKVDLGPLEAQRIAEEMRRWHGGNPAFAEAAVLLCEESGEYRVKKKPIAADKSAPAVNKRRKPR